MAGKRITILTPFEEVVFDVVDPYAAQSSLASGSGHLASPMPGTVVALPLKAGDSVARGVTLVVVEAMKMEHAIVAPHDGTIAALNCAVGDLVAEGAELVILDAVS